MSDSDEEALYMNEIKRFVKEEKNFLSSSDSENSQSRSDESIVELQRKKLKRFRRRRILSTSDSSDSDCKIAYSGSVASFCEEESNLSYPKEPDCITLTSSTEVSDQEGQYKQDCGEETEKRNHIPVISSLDFQRRFLKKKKNRSVEEKRRIDVNIRKAKQNLKIRRVAAQGNWRQSRTFGIPGNITLTSSSKEDNFPLNQEKLVCKGLNQSVMAKRIRLKDINVSLLWQEVQDIIAHAVGEESNLSIKTLKPEVSDLPQRRPSVGNSNLNQSTPISQECFKDDQKFLQNLPSEMAVSSTLRRNQVQGCPDRGNSVGVKPHADHGKEEDIEVINLESFASFQNLARSCEGSYSPPPSETNRGSSDVEIKFVSPGVSIITLATKSPWFEGKASKKKKTSPLEKALTVRCVRIEHFVHFNLSDTPFVEVNGEKVTITPEQWLSIAQKSSTN